MSAEPRPLYYNNREISTCKAITMAATKSGREAERLRSEIEGMGMGRVMMRMKDEKYPHMVESLHPLENPWDTGLTSPERILGMALSRGVHKKLYESMIDAEYTFTEFECDFSPYFHDQYTAMAAGCGTVCELIEVHRKLSGRVYRLHMEGLRAARKKWKKRVKREILHDDD